MADRRRRRPGGFAHRAHKEDQDTMTDTMTVGLSVEVPAAPAQRFDVLAELDRLQERVRSEKAIAILKTHTQHRNIKVRELAETVIYTGTL